MAGLLLVFCSGIFAVGKFNTGLGIDESRTLAFITLVFGSQSIIYAIRQRRQLWGSRPSIWLALSSLADITIASTLAAAGIAMAPLPAWVLASTFAAAVAFTVILLFAKLPVFGHLDIA